MVGGECLSAEKPAVFLIDYDLSVYGKIYSSS
jgi:hypothetical protein